MHTKSNPETVNTLRDIVIDEMQKHDDVARDYRINRVEATLFVESAINFLIDAKLWMHSFEHRAPTKSFDQIDLVQLRVVITVLDELAPELLNPDRRDFYVSLLNGLEANALTEQALAH